MAAPLDLGLPGTLPSINEECVAQAVRAGLSMGGRIRAHSEFDRKHYYYPDLPLGFQITQLREPIVEGGCIELALSEAARDRGEFHSVRIHHIQLEQDSARSVHDDHPFRTLLDHNRAGVGLLEIVTEPDLRSTAEVSAFLKRLNALLRYIGVNEGSLEEGAMRVDVNVSLRRPNGPLGVRCEVKNVNRIRHIIRSIEFEQNRQAAMLERGETIVQESRYWDAEREQTVLMRSKDDELDYRYMPEPDLPPLVLTEAQIDAWRATLPEHPRAATQRLMAPAYALSPFEANTIVDEAGALAFFDSALAELTAQLGSPLSPAQAKRVASWLLTEVFARFHAQQRSLAAPLSELLVTPAQLASVVAALERGSLTGPTAKRVVEAMAEGDGRAANEIVVARGWAVVDDGASIAAACAAVLERHPKELAQLRGGKAAVLQFFVGKTMKELGGRAKPSAVAEALQAELARLDQSASS